MKYFTKDYIKFFKELEKNNSKEWFHANKKRYEAHAKEPMKAFIADLLAKMTKLDPEINADPKKCLGRINRDIRFSKDKTPYNIRFTGHITKGTKADPMPGIAFRFGGRDIGIMGGYYMPNKDRIKSIRDNIMKDPKAFKKLYSAKGFKNKFEKILGEANKRIPKEYQALFEKEPLIANKQFYYVKEYKPDIILQDDLIGFVMDHWKAARPLNDFMSS